MEIIRLNSYRDDRFSQEALLQHTGNSRGVRREVDEFL